MNIEKIKQLYKNVPLSDLTVREKKLYQELFDLSEEKNLAADLPFGRYRLLQFQTEHVAELTQNLSYLLPDIARFDAEKRIAFEKQTDRSLVRSDVADILTTLSQDLGQGLDFYVGIFADRERLEVIYQEEKKIFEKHKLFSEYVLSEGLASFESLILADIKQELAQNQEDQQLVKGLYEAKGNQQQAAKRLYMHRNTLINRMKRYEQHYGLTLTGSDLVLAYNLL